ncbi:ABC transporter substrate-binding protein [Ruegeria pomeroyi]|uniref:Oligopeptide ABC transporter, periplasmic oligopeptide-binding protein n=2 Tax=Ruegeria pomeroyi TaxID=89184 RepID=Q5LVY4_RUEPO|nr:oligopeptide ABC transporter, periplasmic oligopeptide-binding protein [Ruegeria pomeroyi DSS-3]NVK95428.1 ABC transporter substrate-binding protein [Ruegeria pomeroyi]NVL00502.1 ABC transporter substrate-binding protein [Ruegeria pomeroyi]QWV07464.1 ABC transporter substrate-binding protein [Ruegeria pomeroyi]HCE72696.1 peptide ABC transporter substrate-binding protein [Ruegeria sp.]
MLELPRRAFALALTMVLAGVLPLRADTVPTLQESVFWGAEVKSGDLPPIDQRIPEEPLIVDLAAKGREFGTPGGVMRTMITRSKDIRQMVVYGYARLVGYDENYNLVPDLLKSYEVEEDRRFTLHLRKGHKWSDGAPFTSADFEYWWKDVANNPLLSPAGPPDFLLIEGQPPRVSFPDATTVMFEWDKPNPNFLQSLAQARPPFIYRPAHFLKQFHQDYADTAQLAAAVEENRVKSWAALHNKLDNMYQFDNAQLPTLQPWINASEGKKIRHNFVRNPYYHRIDTRGVQLPYIDIIEMEIVAPGLVAAKSNAGEVDLQGRGLDFRDASILKKGEADGGYKTYLWQTGVASQIAIYPNLNHNDDVWRALLRDARLRRALSLAIDRDAINRALYFKLAKPGAMAVLPASPFFKQEHRDAWAAYDPARASALLDEVGLDKRDGAGIRLLPDGRPMELVIETAGERQEVENALQIITDTWREIGVKLVMRPLDRDILRNRVFAGTTMASVWFGWDNGLPQAYTSPAYLAPTDQVFLAWPKWGQHYQTAGQVGEAPDLPEAQRLMELLHDWERANNDQDRAAAWSEMLAIHADQIYGIGILAEAPQPIVVSARMRNVPKKGMWAWDPGAHFGVHRMDEFFIQD